MGGRLPEGGTPGRHLPAGASIMTSAKSPNGV